MCGAVGWSTGQLWKSTPYESSNTFVGWCKRNGVGRWDTSKKGIGAPFTQGDILKLQEQAEKRAIEHPDQRLKDMYKDSSGKLTKEQKIHAKELSRKRR